MSTFESMSARFLTGSVHHIASDFQENSPINYITRFDHSLKSFSYRNKRSTKP